MTPGMSRAALLVALLALSGCGTLFNEEQRVVTIESSPPGAQVEVDGKRVGRTPYEITVPNNRRTAVVVDLAGHKSSECDIVPQIEPLWIVLDFWFLFPLVVDAATGRWNDVPANCMVVFGKAPQREPDPDTAPSLKPPSPRPAPTPTDDKPKPPTEKPKPFPFPK